MSVAFDRFDGEEWPSQDSRRSSTKNRIFCTLFVVIDFGFTSNIGSERPLVLGGTTFSLIRFFSELFHFSFQQLLRVQSPEGTKRIEIQPSATIRDLYEQIHGAFEFDGYGFAVFRERNGTNELSSSRSHTIHDENLKHGDMIFVKNISGSVSVNFK